MNQVLAFEWPFSELVIERLGWVLVHSFGQFALVALLAGLTVRAMRKCSATTRYGLLVVAMAVSVAAPMATWMLIEIDPWPDLLANQVAILQPGPSETIASAAGNGRSKEKMVSPSDSEFSGIGTSLPVAAAEPKKPLAEPAKQIERVIESVAAKVIVFENGSVVLTDANTKYVRLTDKGEEPAERTELKEGVRVRYEIEGGQGGNEGHHRSRQEEGRATASGCRAAFVAHHGPYPEC